MVSSWSYREEVVGLEPFLEEGVEHILRSEVEGDGSTVGLGEFAKPLSQGIGGVRDVLHDVRRKPYFAYAELLVVA